MGGGVAAVVVVVGSTVAMDVDFTRTVEGSGGGQERRGASHQQEADGDDRGARWRSRPRRRNHRGVVIRRLFTGISAVMLTLPALAWR